MRVRGHGPSARGAARFFVTGGAPTDEATGVPIYSVYGDTAAKKPPTPEALKGLDALVVDLQDIIRDFRNAIGGIN